MCKTYDKVRREREREQEKNLESDLNRPKQKIKRKKLSHKQVAYWAYLCIQRYRMFFGCCSSGTLAHTHTHKERERERENLIASGDLICFFFPFQIDHIFSMFRLSDQAHKFLKTLNCTFPFVHHIYRTYLFVCRLLDSKLNCFSSLWRTKWDSHFLATISILKFHWRVLQTHTKLRNRSTEQEKNTAQSKRTTCRSWAAKIIKAKRLHMNDKNDAKTNDLCECIKSDSMRMGWKMDSSTWWFSFKSPARMTEKSSGKKNSEPPNGCLYACAKIVFTSTATALLFFADTCSRVSVISFQVLWSC